jgi:hypothetical protein
MPSRDQRQQARREKPRPLTGLSRLSVWFPADQMAALRALAAKRQQSEPALVREAVRRLLGREGEVDNLPPARSTTAKDAHEAELSRAARSAPAEGLPRKRRRDGR